MTVRSFDSIRLSGHLALLFCLLLVSPACSRRADTRPLDEVGMTFSSVRELRELEVTEEEISELAKAKSAGLSEATCVGLLRIARSRNVPFADGDAAVRLRRAGISEAGILELARLNQLGSWAGNAELMRFAGISEQTILVVARRRSEGLPAMSGASVAQLKNAGMSEAAVRELARRGVNDDEAKVAFSMSRRGMRDSEILRRFPGR